MTKLSLDEAEGQLAALVQRACAGEEIVIEADGNRVSLVPRREEPRQGKPRQLGLDPDLFVLHDGWDDPMTEDELAEWEDGYPGDQLLVTPKPEEDDPERAWRLERGRLSRPLTPQERERGLAAIAEARRSQEKLLASNGGRPFTPEGWLLNDESRDERSRQLS